MGSDTASHVPKQFAPCHIQSLLPGPTPVLITPLLRGLIVHTWHTLGPKQTRVQVSEPLCEQDSSSVLLGHL